MKPALRLLPGRWAVCKLPADASVPPWALNAHGPLASITRTTNELSLVVPEAVVPSPPDGSLHIEREWRVFAVAGPMPFDLVGVLADLTAPLARANVPVFALSTFDTDYLLVKEADAKNAKSALAHMGYQITSD